VGYPILNLRRRGGGPLSYVRALEETIIRTLAQLGLVAGSDQRPTGVWVGQAKIAAIGVKISRGVSLHGFALNVDPDLSYFDHIVPCGMPDARVTSVSRELGSPVSVDQVATVLTLQFGRVFRMEIVQERDGVAAPIAVDTASTG
jgi:lipoate-protein ligase B